MNGVVPLYYEMKKAAPSLISNKAILDGILKAYSSCKIGIYSNMITKIWNGDEVTDEGIETIKRLVMESNFSIDSAKTNYMPTRPEKFDTQIKNYTRPKVPYFFMAVKDKKEDQVEPLNESTMNRISNRFFNSNKMHYCKTVSKFDYRMLMNKKSSFMIDDDNPIIASFDRWNKKSRYLTDEENHTDSDNLYVYDKIREGILNECRVFGKDFVVNTLVAFYYTIRTSSSKKTLWSCFGEEIVKNLKENIKDLGNICPICGKRFKPKDNANTTYCSEECYKTGHREEAKKFKER